MSPKAGGGGRCCRVSANEYNCAHGAQINFGDLTPYLTCGGQLNEDEVAVKIILITWYHTG
jgi:hypothetical protein